MIIDLNPEEVRFMRQAVQLAIEVSEKMAFQGLPQFQLAEKARVVAQGVLHKLNQPNPDLS